MPSSERVEVKFVLENKMTKALAGVELVCTFTEWLTENSHYDRLTNILSNLCDEAKVEDEVELTVTDAFKLLMNQVLEAEELEPDVEEALLVEKLAELRDR